MVIGKMNGDSATAIYAKNRIVIDAIASKFGNVIERVENEFF